MYKLIPAFAFIVLAVSATAHVQAKSTDVSLTSFAARSKYDLQWLLPERAIRLYRPGVVIVLRPGVREYDVNNHVEFSDSAPVYVNGDLLITQALAARLSRLASMAAAAQTDPAEAPRSSDAPVAQSAGQSGPITIAVQPEPGSEAVRVSGHAPSTGPVTITLLATLSPDLPTVVVSRHYVQPDANGQYQTVITIASDYFRDSLLHVFATSQGSTSETATVQIGAPNAGVTVPSDKPYCTNGICPI